MNDTFEQIRDSFDEFKRGVVALQADVARGDLGAVENGLREALAAVTEIERSVLCLLGAGEAA